MSTEPTWANTPPEEQREWLSNATTSRFLRHLTMETARSLESVNEFTEAGDQHRSAVMSGAVKALRWVEAQMTSVKREPESEDEETDDEFVDPGALPKGTK